MLDDLSFQGENSHKFDLCVSYVWFLWSVFLRCRYSLLFTWLFGSITESDFCHLRFRLTDVLFLCHSFFPLTWKIYLEVHFWESQLQPHLVVDLSWTLESSFSSNQTRIREIETILLNFRTRRLIKRASGLTRMYDSIWQWHLRVQTMNMNVDFFNLVTFATTCYWP